MKAAPPFPPLPSHALHAHGGHAQTNCANNLIPAERLSERAIGRKRLSPRRGGGEGV